MYKKPYSKDLTDKQFGKLTVKYYVGKNKRGCSIWHCECDCGNEVDVISSSLTSGHTKSCGCLHSKNITFRKPLAGKVFNQIEVLEDYTDFEYTGSNRHFVKCRCLVCGTEFTTKATDLSWKYSCGCSTLRGKSNITHGESKTPFYTIYRGIKSRCSSPSDTNYSKYGAKGIKCLWGTYEEFRSDMYDSYLAHVEQFGRENTSIDRIDVNGDYCKENCRWATIEEQANNKHSNKFYTYLGETHTISEWERLYGIKRGTLWARLNVQGLGIGEALDGYSRLSKV